MDEATLTDIRNKIANLNTNELASEFLKKLQSRSRQEVAARLEDKIKQPLEDLKDRVARRLWMQAQQWSGWNEDDNSPFLYPTGSAGGTKLFYKKGDTSVLFYEQAPQMRAVTFDPALISEAADERGRKFYFNLAFPYVVFAIQFKGGRYVATHFSYLREPLTSLHQRPLTPNLANIDKTSMRVCHGDFNFKEYKVGDYHGMTLGAIDHFWRSEFNGSWAEGYNEAKLLDERLKTPRKWEAASRQNPMFVVDINWSNGPYTTYRHMITRLFEADSKTQEVNQKLYNDLVTETVSELQTLLQGQKEDDVPEDPAITTALNQSLAKLLAGIIAP